MSDRRVLIVCTGNSCRSALAEALWRHHWGDRWEVFSAGAKPTGTVHPLAREVLVEREIDESGLVSEDIERFDNERFDLVITVCDQARESCHRIPPTDRVLHWPFPDPALFAEGESKEEALGVFRTARDAIESRILRYRETLERVESLDGWLRQVLAQLPSPAPTARAEAFESLLLWVTSALLTEEDLWSALPGAIRERYEPFGWEWNGFYRSSGISPNRRLTLAAAAGPPVCATIEEQPGGLGHSGMCFDALFAGHPIAARSVKSWPGYVSCDGESGLKTEGGLVIPISDGRHRAHVVWDLDATAPLDPSDLPLFSALFTRLAHASPLPKEWR